jgi:sarcosine oxidase
VPDVRRCVVVGAGVLGLSTARALARRGWSVEVLEAADVVGHAAAGSKGSARIFRLGYPEPHYVEMAVKALDLWHALEEQSGRRLLHVTGQVTLGDAGTLDEIDAALRAAGARCERIGGAESRARYPGLATPGPALVEAESGVLAADACLRALLSGGGFALQTGMCVTAVSESDDGVEVLTAGGTARRADVAVLCAGPGTLALLGPPARSASVVAPSLPQVAYFAPAPASALAHVRDPVRSVPVFIEWGAEMIYGLPVPEPTTPGLVKVSHHTQGAPLETYDPTGWDPPGDHPVLLARLVDAVCRLLPDLDPHPVATERCVYDNTADGDFVLDRVGNVVVGCGTSGHGFKFAPLLGELLADLAENETPRVDLAPFGLNRG